MVLILKDLGQQKLVEMLFILSLGRLFIELEGDDVIGL